MNENPPVLIVMSEIGKGQTFPLTKNIHFCGRAFSNDIHLDDRSVSTIHCKFAKTGSGSYIVIDLESTNGIAVNNKLTKYSELKNGDLLDLGNTKLLFSEESGAVGSIENTYVDTYYVPDGKNQKDKSKDA